MILQERQPVFGRVAAASDTSQIARHAPFRDHVTQLLKLSVNPGGSPIRVLLGQATDQNPNLLGDLGAAAASPGSPAPIETKAGAVPADHGLGLDDDQDVGPAGPKVAEGGPEESVQGVQYWPRPLAFEHGELLTEGEDFEGGIAPTAKEGRDAGNEREDGFGHELTFVTWRNVASSGGRSRDRKYYQTDEFKGRWDPDPYHIG